MKEKASCFSRVMPDRRRTTDARPSAPTTSVGLSSVDTPSTA